MSGSRRRRRVAIAAVAAVGLAVCAGAAALPVYVTLASLDPIGDAGGAPDVGKVVDAVLLDGTDEKLIVGTWLDHSTMAVGEHVSWLLDFGPGVADGPSGFDHLLELWHHAGYPQQWNFFKWAGGAWHPTQSGSIKLATHPDGRVYWSMELTVPDQSANITLRTYTGSTATGGTDQAPDLSSPRLVISLQPHGLVDPLKYCTYAGGCVLPANEMSPYGPQGGGSDQLAQGGIRSSCGLATRALQSTDRKIRSVSASRRRTRSKRTRRRLDGELRSLRSRRAGQARTVSRVCG
jgi:hypothetical protein